MNTAVLNLIVQLAQLSLAEVPNVAAIIALLKDSTAKFETMLADADAIEAAEVAKLKAQLGQ